MKCLRCCDRGYTIAFGIMDACGICAGLAELEYRAARTGRPVSDAVSSTPALEKCAA